MDNARQTGLHEFDPCGCLWDKATQNDEKPGGGINSDGSSIRLKDMADIKLESENYYVNSYHNGQPSIPMGIFLATGANALEVAKAVDARRYKISYPL